MYINFSKSIDDAKDLCQALSGGMRVPSITSSSNVPWFRYWAGRQQRGRTSAKILRSGQPQCPHHPEEDDQVESVGGAQEEQEVSHLPCWPKETLKPMETIK
jgi:hypothetical protein